MKRILVSVINDLVTDQRVHKSCQTLVEDGYEVHLIGRQLKNSLPMDQRTYSHHRMKLLFTKGALFYAFYNIRLFFYLLFKKVDGLHANDLDTLLANYLVSKLRKLPLVYDSHEYFTEVPEIQGRFSQKVWKQLEKRIFPKLKHVVTVNDSIAQLFHKQYGNEVKVMRNLPPQKKHLPISISRTKLGLTDSDYVVILQGAGINVDRGAEEAVESMRYLDDVRLLIVGGGDVMPILKAIVEKYNLKNKVLFIDKQLPSVLPSYTAVADLGLSLDKDSNLNYLYSLPNKIFDYASCGVPILASKLPEVEKVITKYNLGMISPTHNPKDIASLIQDAKEQNLKQKLNKFLESASKDLCWENESIILAQLWNKALPHG